MNRLERNHPVQLVIGCLIRQEEIARRKGQMTFAILSNDAAQWASEVRDVLKEIASDAAYGQDRCKAAIEDGIVTEAELHEVEQVLAEIEREALTGRIEP